MYYVKCSKELFANSWHCTLSNEPEQCYMCICIISKLTASFIFTSSGLSLQMRDENTLTHVIKDQLCGILSLVTGPCPAVRHLQYRKFAHGESLGTKLCHPRLQWKCTGKFSRLLLANFLPCQYAGIILVSCKMRVLIPTLSQIWRKYLQQLKLLTVDI